MEDTAGSLDGEGTQHRCEVGGERRTAALVVDEGHRVAGDRQPAHQLDHVVAVLTAHPRRAHDRHVLAEDVERGLLARKLRPAVDGLRVGRIVFSIGAIERPVEHVVGGDVHEVCVRVSARGSQHTDAVFVDVERSVDLGLATIHRRERGTVDDRIQARRSDDTVDVVLVRDVELRAVDSDHLVAGCAQMGDDIGPELARGSGDQHPHRPARSFSGSHHSRLVRYHSTVAARFSSKLRDSVQPSSVIFEMSTE